jgi:toxin HigB-1
MAPSPISSIGVQLAFASPSLRQLCANRARAKRELGEAVAAKLRHRLADLRSAVTPQDLVAGRPREVEEGDRTMMAVELTDGVRLLFCPNHNDTPRLDSGRVDWTRVTRIQVLEIRRGDE